MTGNMPMKTVRRNGKPEEGKMVIVNLQKTHLDRHCHLRIRAKLDDVFKIVMEALGMVVPSYQHKRSPPPPYQPRNIFDQGLLDEGDCVNISNSRIEEDHDNDNTIATAATTTTSSSSNTTTANNTSNSNRCVLPYQEIPKTENHSDKMQTGSDLNLAAFSTPPSVTPPTLDRTRDEEARQNTRNKGNKRRREHSD